MNKCLERLYNGIIKENPTFVLMLGMCPTLAVTSSLQNGFGMGMTTMVVLTASNAIIALLRNVIPDKVRMPAFIVIVASFVTIVQFLLQAYLPALNTSLGIYIPLIVVNCIILGRAEAYACNHNVAESAMDGLKMGLSYTLSLLAMSFIRQLLGTGCMSFTNPLTSAEVFNVRLIPAGFEIPVFTTQTGAFMTFAVLAALVTAYKNNVSEKEKKEAK